MNNVTVKQHYVPQFLIKKFYNEKNKVECYNLKEGRKFLSSSENICAENNLYECVGFKENEIEKYLSQLEGEVSILLGEILKYLDIFPLNQGDSYIITVEKLKESNKIKEKIDYLIFFVIIQILRHPFLVNQIGPIIKETINSFDENENIKEIKEFKYFKEKLLDAGITDMSTVYKMMGFKELFDINRIVRYLYPIIQKEHKIVFFRTEKLHFICSDTSVVFDCYNIDFNNGDIKNLESNIFENSDFYFSLTPHYCLGLLKPYSWNSDVLNDEIMIRSINFRSYERITCCQIYQSTQYIFSDVIDEKIMNIISKCKNENNHKVNN